MKVINKYLEDNRLEGKNQEGEGAETYFIIHPVLKHLAMLGIEKIQEGDKDREGDTGSG